MAPWNKRKTPGERVAESLNGKQEQLERVKRKMKDDLAQQAEKNVIGKNPCSSFIVGHTGNLSLPQVMSTWNTSNTVTGPFTIGYGCRQAGCDVTVSTIGGFCGKHYPSRRDQFLKTLQKAPKRQLRTTEGLAAQVANEGLVRITEIDLYGMMLVIPSETLTKAWEDESLRKKRKDPARVGAGTSNKLEEVYSDPEVLPEGMEPASECCTCGNIRRRYTDDYMCWVCRKEGS